MMLYEVRYTVSCHSGLFPSRIDGDIRFQSPSVLICVAGPAYMDGALNYI